MGGIDLFRDGFVSWYVEPQPKRSMMDVILDMARVAQHRPGCLSAKQCCCHFQSGPFVQPEPMEEQEKHIFGIND